jgi:hypothetical protein
MTKPHKTDYEYSFGNPEIDRLLNTAVAAYGEGRLVIVLVECGARLHGDDLVQSMRDLGKGNVPEILELLVSMKTLVLKGCPREYLDSSGWPKILETARLMATEKPN